MRTDSIPTRLTTAVAAALTLAACGGTVDFSVEQDLPVNWNGTGGTAVAAYDLAASASSAWKHRDKIDSISITSADATVQNATSAAGTLVSGDVWLLPEGASDPGAAGSVQVGSWTNEEVVNGNVIALAVTPALNDFVKNAFNGSGKFSVYASGAGAGGAPVVCTLHVVLGAKLKWKLF